MTTDTNPQDKWFDESREEWQTGCQADLDLPTCYCKSCEDWRSQWTEEPRVPHTDIGRCLCVGCCFDRAKPPTRKLPRMVRLASRYAQLAATWRAFSAGYAQALLPTWHPTHAPR